MKKLRLSLPNLREILNVVKFWRLTYLKDHYFKQQKKDLLVISYYSESNRDPNQILMGRVKIPEATLITIFIIFETF